MNLSGRCAWVNVAYLCQTKLSDWVRWRNWSCHARIWSRTERLRTNWRRQRYTNQHHRPYYSYPSDRLHHGNQRGPCLVWRCRLSIAWNVYVWRKSMKIVSENSWHVPVKKQSIVSLVDQSIKELVILFVRLVSCTIVWRTYSRHGRSVNLDDGVFVDKNNEDYYAKALLSGLVSKQYAISKALGLSGWWRTNAWWYQKRDCWEHGART